jgi:hypothetical protein
MQYGQFCPIAKATEILGERWTSRLKPREEQGLVARRRISGQRGHEYFPTSACEALLPVLIAIGEWGLIWVRDMLVEDDFDIDFLMYYLERSVDPEKLPGDQTVIRFQFTELREQRNWWLLVERSSVQICLTPPARDVDIYFTTTLRTMHDVWMGDRSYRDAVNAEDLIIEGEPALTRNVSSWLRPSVFASSDRAPIPASLAQVCA